MDSIELATYFRPNSKYLRWYISLVYRRKIKPIEEQYTEVHHIVPKSLAPEFEMESWNLVRLSYREHFLAHFLLYKHFKKISYTEGFIKMGHVFVLMKATSINSRYFDIAKKIKRDTQLKIGKNNITAAGRKRLSDRMKANNPASLLYLCEICGNKIGANNFHRHLKKCQTEIKQGFCTIQYKKFKTGCRFCGKLISSNNMKNHLKFCETRKQVQRG